jgi:hypothetical protein
MDEIEVREDAALFDRWVKGEAEGFSKLYDKYKNRVFSFVLRMANDRSLAEDLVQETFLAALRNADQFDRSRSFLSWLFGIAQKERSIISGMCAWRPSTRAAPRGRWEQGSNHPTIAWRTGI